MRVELTARHKECFGWALCCCRRDCDMAAEVLQRTYVKVLDGRAAYAGRGPFKTWLFGVIRRTALDERRRRWLSVLRLLAYSRHRQQPVEGPTGPEDEWQAVFRTALAALAARQREVLHLVFYQDLSLSEAAAVMGISIGAARQHYERGKKQLRQKLRTQTDFQEQAHEPATE